MHTAISEEAVRASFGIGNTSAKSVVLGSADDLLDAFRRFTAADPSRYTLDEFKNFVTAVRTNAPAVEGLEYYAHLLDTYVQRIPDLGWERCARQVWPLLTDCVNAINEKGFTLDRLGVRPVFQAVGGDAAAGYEIRAFLCMHGYGRCDCGEH